MNNLGMMKKIESLNRCLERLRTKRPDRVEMLLGDIDLQDIISINLERAVHLTVDTAAMVSAERGLAVSNTMAGNFKVLSDAGLLDPILAERLQKSVGFRNISVHEYQAIDWALVFHILHHHLDNFDGFIRAVLPLMTV